MAEPDKTIYRTTDPELVALWEQWQEARREFSAKCDAFIAEFAPAGCEAMVTESFGTRVVGVTVEGYASDLHEGWRLDRKRWMLVPFKKTARGKIIGKAMEGLHTPDPRTDLKGMPSWALIGIAICHPGVQPHDGALYMIWSGEGPNEGIDATIWEPVKLSEWYAIQEAKES